MGRRRTLPVGRVLPPLFGVAAVLAAVAMGPAIAPGQDATTADLDRGEVVFELCAQCHGSDGAGRELYGAPAIAGLSSWYIENQVRKFKTGVRGRHFDDVEGLRMRPMALVLKEDSDIPAVAAYVASLPDPRPEPTLEGGDASRGAALYALCASCHGPDGSGMEALKAPSLLATDDWYQLRQLQKFRAGVRGGPTDPEGVLMAPMAMQLADDQALLDVLAHVRTLSPASTQ